MLFWKPKPKKKAEKPTAKRQIAPSAIELPKDIPHITIPKPEKSAVKGSTVTQAKKATPLSERISYDFQADRLCRIPFF
ncbi:hypothetical protein ABHB30_14940 [Flavonifractor plautii]|uniref:hypothetical protein n=1 Tax=Flavonifractor plautii TaxID=292800 RepID=UPI00325ABB1F